MLIAWILEMLYEMPMAWWSSFKSGWNQGKK